MQRTMTDGYSRVSVSVTATETAAEAAAKAAAAKRAQSLILPQRRPAAAAPEKIALAEDFRGRGKRRSVTAHCSSMLA